MLQHRVIPVLLLKDQGLVKTVKFRSPRYVGDPINAIRIFNDKEVDELVFLDITASTENRKPNLKIISDIASECFMPVCYGGGVKNVTDMEEVFRFGIEKVSLNCVAAMDPLFVKEASENFGSQSIVVSIDVKKNILGKYKVFTKGGIVSTGYDPVTFSVEMEKMGAGEILLNSIDRDGMMTGYDVELIEKVVQAVDIPVIACGGAGCVKDFSMAIKNGGASAVAAGSMFVFHGKHRAVLISYPDRLELQEALE